MTKWLLGKEKTAKSSSVIWNTIGGTVNAGQSAIILIFISHRLGLVTAGMVTIAYALAQLFMSVAKYGVRNYQVTDVQEQTSFREYFFARLITLVGAGVALVVYLFIVIRFGDCTADKAWIIFEVVILKMVDSFEDVFIGRFQQVGRLDIGAKIMAIRLIFSTAVICIAVFAGTNIFIALFLAIICSVILDIWFLGKTFKTVNYGQSKTSKNNIWQLFKVCLPLCVGTTLAIYIGNAPKYMINWYMDESTQAIFGYIMMPVFIITLLNQFIYQPVIKDLGDFWVRREITAFRKRVYRQCLIVAGLIVAALILGMTIGLPILSFIYGTDLNGYRPEFAVLLLGGGFYALAYYLNVPITTIRRQNSLAIGYLVATVVSIVLGRWFVIQQGIMGAAIMYLVITVLLAAIYFVVLMWGIRKGSLLSYDDNSEK